MEKLAFLAILVLIASGSMTSASLVNEASEAQKLLITTKAAQEQLKMQEELYSRISAAIQKYYETPKQTTQTVSCLPFGSPCAGLQGGNCCSNNCVFFVAGIPVGVCGTA